ncbi:MAG: Yip1 family protein [Gammaproteobacteria bacterium]
MFIKHIIDLFLRPSTAWEEIRDEKSGLLGAMIPALLLGLIPVVCGYLGTTQTGWRIGAGDPVKLTNDSATLIAVMYYIVIQVAVFSIGWMIHWMAKTYGSEQALPICIRLAAYIATPLFLVGFMQLNPVLWLNLVVGLPAAAYTVFLLYTGIPVVMDISKDRGFLFSSAVLMVGMVGLVGMLAVTVFLWGIGVGPVLTS